MRVPFTWLVQSKDVQAAVTRVLAGGQFILGQEATDFEREWATFCGTQGAAAVASGTAALFLALQACGIRPGDEVAVPSLTFAATAEAVVHVGARPVFVDIDPVTHTMAPQALEAVLTPRTRAVIPVHLFGHPADMGAINDIASGRSIYVIEDAAQAHGAKFAGGHCGALGDLAAFSYYPTKNLGAVGDAGGVTTSNPELLQRVQSLRDHGRVGQYQHIEPGWCERMDTLQAAVLRVKLPLLEERNSRRREHANAYTRALEGVVSTPAVAPWAEHAFHLYVVRAGNRDHLLHGLQERGVDARIHYRTPLHKQRAFLTGDLLPATEAFCEEALSLPLYPELTDEQRDYVVEQVIDLLK